MFYIYNIRPVPENIYRLFTPIDLAFLIMGEGAGNIYKSLYLCTDSFSNYEVVKLMNVLLIRYDLKSNLLYFFFFNKARRYIVSSESNKLNKLNFPYMHSIMLYKISGQRKNKIQN